MKRKNKQQPAFFIIAVFALAAVLCFNLYRLKSLRMLADHNMNPDRQNFELSQTDLASIRASHISRNIVLGKAVYKKPEKKSQLDALLYDRSFDKQFAQKKWDLKSINAFEAWRKHHILGSRKVKVCVIDTGIDVNHPDLQANLWTNPGETGLDSAGQNKATNQIDDDKDGCVDDVHGCNLITGNGDISDHEGHGTHVAGIIGATGAAGGVIGVSPRVTLIIAKYYDPRYPMDNNLLNEIKSIHYCIDHDADIINFSGGGLEPSAPERAAIAEARKKGILFVAAAGNEYSDSDTHHYYPADYSLDNIISVTAYNRRDKVLQSSNYGTRTVDIAAPGKNVYSTLPGGLYGYLTGTSQATAVVSGVAALLKAEYPDFDAARLIAQITQTGDLDPIRLAGKTRYEKRLNAYRALSILGFGVSVTGTIAQNTANLRPGQFALGRHAQNAGMRETASDNMAAGFNLTSFSDDLQNYLHTQTITIPKPTSAPILQQQLH